MPPPIESISTALFDFLKNRVELTQGVDEDGTATETPEEMRVFTFDFENRNGKDCGCVVISVLDDSDGSNSVKIYFGQELTDADPDTQKDWRDFLEELRRVSKIHLMGFDVRNINKSKLTRRDIGPVFESTFGPIDGTVKTSRQKLGNMEIIIKHTSRVDPKQKGARSRRIQRIYLANPQGEKFLLPFKSLKIARAMARHIEAGGNPYDEVGKRICHLAEELTALSKFVRKHGGSVEEGSKAWSAIQASKERIKELRRQLSSMNSKGGYTKNTANFVDDEILDDQDEGETFFNDLDEDEELVLPYVQRAYRAHSSGTPEEDEFTRWVSAGDDPEEEVLMDAESDPEELHFAGNITRRPKDRHEQSVSMAGGTAEKDPANANQGFTRQDVQEDIEDGNAEFDYDRSENEYGDLTGCQLYGHRFTNNDDEPLSSCLHCGEPQDPLDESAKLTEADEPSAAGWGSPLSFPYVKVPQHFRTPKEIEKLKDTSGEMSPLSLLNCEERDTDAEGRDLDRIVYLSGGVPFEKNLDGKSTRLRGQRPTKTN